MSRHFYFKQFSLAEVHSLVISDSYKGPYQVLPLRDRVDLVAMVIKEYCAFP